MLKRLATVGSSSWYWLAVLLLGVTMEAVALFYQYQLEYWPCVVCIHVRIWVMGFILLALLALLVRKSRLLCAAGHVLTMLIAIGLLERSWMLLGIERGFAEGDCSMETGLPAWLAVDEWFPWLFKVWEACGYTPELLFGITMAEALVVTAALIVLTSFTLAVTFLLGKGKC